VRFRERQAHDKGLTLRKLESAPRTALTVFFAFNHTRIAGQVPIGAEAGAISRLDLAKRTGKPVPTGASLTMCAAAVHIDKDIKLVFTVGYHKWLTHHYSMVPLLKILGKLFAIYRDFTTAVFYVDTRNRCLSSAGSNTKIFHQSTSYNSIFSGC
jgi:hypothetical protein